MDFCSSVSVKMPVGQLNLCTAQCVINVMCAKAVYSSHQYNIWAPMYIAVSRHRSTYPFSIFIPLFRVIWGILVSGQNSLEIASDAGADITEAVSKWEAETWNSRCQKISFGQFISTAHRNNNKNSRERQWKSLDTWRIFHTKRAWKNQHCLFGRRVSSSMIQGYKIVNSMEKATCLPLVITPIPIWWHQVPNTEVG